MVSKSLTTLVIYLRTHFECSFTPVYPFTLYELVFAENSRARLGVASSAEAVIHPSIRLDSLQVGHDTGKIISLSFLELYGLFLLLKAKSYSATTPPKV